MNPNKKLLESVADKIADYNAILDEIKSQINQINNPSKLEVQQEVLNLESKKIFLEARIGSLEETGENRLNSSENGLVNAIDDLDNAFNKITYRIEKLRRIP